MRNAKTNRTAFEMVAAHVATLGTIVAHSREPYWKISRLDECLWVVSLKDEPSLRMKKATAGIASGWVGTPDSLSVDRRHGETFHPALSSVFVDLEPEDGARHAKVTAKFDFGDKVYPVSDDTDWRSAIIVGRSFDITTGWAYALQEEPAGPVFCMDEGELRS